MRLDEIENIMENSQAVWLVCIYLVRRDGLWEQADYISYEDYVHRRWGVGRRQADRWASAGEIMLDLFPSLAPGAVEAPEAAKEQFVPKPLASDGRPGAGLAPGRLRPLVALKRSGYSAQDIREVWMEVMTKTQEPTEKQVKVEVIKRKQESLQGMCSLEGAEALRQMIALHVYDLVRYESESDELATMCREAIISVLRAFAEEEPL